MYKDHIVAEMTLDDFGNNSQIRKNMTEREHICYICID